LLLCIVSFSSVPSIFVTSLLWPSHNTQ
jgi:hypothetical protein